MTSRDWRNPAIRPDSCLASLVIDRFATLWRRGSAWVCLIVVILPCPAAPSGMLTALSRHITIDEICPRRTSLNYTRRDPGQIVQKARREGRAFIATSVLLMPATRAACRRTAAVRRGVDVRCATAMRHR